MDQNETKIMYRIKFTQLLVREKTPAQKATASEVRLTEDELREFFAQCPCKILRDFADVPKGNFQFAMTDTTKGCMCKAFALRVESREESGDEEIAAECEKMEIDPPKRDFVPGRVVRVERTPIPQTEPKPRFVTKDGTVLTESEYEDLLRRGRNRH